MVERDENGHLKKGSILNPNGRPTKSIEENFNALIDKAVSEKDWLEILSVAAKQAKRGDSIARAWLADRRYGKAIQKTELTGEDGDPIVVTLIKHDASQS